MKSIQEYVYLKMAKDSELLSIFDLADPSNETEISKRLVPTPPQTSGDEIPTLIHFRFTRTGKTGSAALIRRPVQFRIWSTDNSLRKQQDIADRLQEIFVGQASTVVGTEQATEFFFDYESEIPGVVFGRYGWVLQLSIGTNAKIFSKGG